VDTSAFSVGVNPHFYMVTKIEHWQYMISKEDKHRLRLVKSKLKYYLVSNGLFLSNNIVENIDSYFILTGQEKKGKKLAFRYLLEESKNSKSPLFISPPKPKEKKQKKKHGKERKIARELRRKEYSDYINSKKWISFSSELKVLRGRKCEKCGVTGTILHAHHLTYDRLGCERPEDILIVCIPCHEEIHGRKFKH
jgi:hypothetical protein